ncbi:MAG: hypothetical protein ACT4TC_22080 [Myxococcaceae bacterium]
MSRGPARGLIGVCQNVLASQPVDEPRQAACYLASITPGQANAEALTAACRGVNLDKEENWKKVQDLEVFREFKESL